MCVAALRAGAQRVAWTMGRITDQVWNADAAEQRRLAARLRSAHALVNSTSRERDKSAAAKAAWSAAAADMHRVWREFYDEDQPDSRAEAVRAGDRAAINKAVRFVELGPRFFHSGYAKERLLRALKKAPLTGPQIRRLRAAFGRTVDEGGRELAVWIQIAPRLDVERVREVVAARASSPDSAVRRRAAWATRRLDEVTRSQSASRRQRTRTARH
jgi:hypothetical protein